MKMKNQVLEQFKKIYPAGSSPLVVRSPGRINIIGEHTDYNGGLVLPAAIDKAAYLAIGPAESGIGKWISADFSDDVTIDFSNIARHPKGWPDYLSGIIDQFRRDGKEPRAFNAVLAADVPIGAGLSSSAAIETVTAFAINELEQYNYTRLELALLAQRAEHQYIGLKVGIMDMFASLHGKQGHAIRLDCRSLDFYYAPLDLGNYKIVLLDTGVKHELASSEYNVRRQQCEEGVQIIRKYHPEVKQLRDVTTEMLETHKQELDPLIYKRCYFVVEENKRVDKACEALRLGSLDKLGQLLYESHAGLQYDYEVSCRELDLLVKLVKEETFVLGARMMGGGFGGCTINIIHKDSIAALLEKIGPVYKQNTGNELHSNEVVTGDGAREIS